MPTSARPSAGDLLRRIDVTWFELSFSELLGFFLTHQHSALSLWVASFLRTLSGLIADQRLRENDFRWLGFSYVAFRLIHTIRDKQSGRFPSVDVGEFITHVIFFPAFTAGPIDRLERFIKDLRAPFAGLNLETLYSAGQRLLLGSSKNSSSPML